MNKTAATVKKNIFFFISLACCLLISSCKKDAYITSSDARIETIDSLKYDTVFTSIGSVTQSFKINNLNNQKLLLSNVKLMGGSSSPFKININGVVSNSVSDIEMAANDSIYVFVTVKINPNLSNQPFVVKDSIQISYNGNIRFVQLEAYGQNANFLRNIRITGNTRWTSTLPYVLLGTVTVDTAATLTIDSGCKIYAHANAPLLVEGTLIVNGTKQEPVVFTGDRLDEDYKDLPASWPGIYFLETSKDNVLTYAIVKNAYQAIVAEKPSANSNQKVVLHQCIVDNAFDAGLLCVNSSLDADNSLISNCGSNVYFVLGGKYNLTNCTVATYSAYISHKKPVLFASNYAENNGSIVSAGLNATFKNCIFWGEPGFVNNETSVSKLGSDPFAVIFDHCLYRAESNPENSSIVSSRMLTEPMFDSINVSKKYFDFRINNLSAPGINNGAATSFSKDLDNNNRSNGLPDIGAYENQ
jgi:hypothetical protein